MKQSSNTVEFSCACGKEFRARIEQGGKKYTCPSCGVSVRVPKVAIAPSPAMQPVDPLSTPESKHADGALKRLRTFQIPSTFAQMLAYLFASWAVLTLIALILSLFSIYIH